MELLGIIAEYDPFHTGHQYHIRQSREKSGCDAVVIALSGDFTQRGGAALLDKFARSEMAIRGGADLVVELPLPWCMAGAETFARGGVGLLTSLGCVRTLSFGCECENFALLEEATDALQREETEERLLELLHSGIPYASAREKALEQIGGESLASLLREPNNILGIEYLKAIRTLESGIRPLGIVRKGSAHNGEGSASALRNSYYKGEKIEELLPEGAGEVLRREEESGRMLDAERLETAVLSRLRMLSEEEWRCLPDCAEGLENRLYRAARKEGSIDAILTEASAKRYPRARLRRILYAAALGIRKEDARGLPPYIRPLAANEKGREALRQIRESAGVPIISRGGQARTLNEQAEYVFQLGGGAHDLYALARKEAKWRNSDEDYQKSLRIFCDF